MRGALKSLAWRSAGDLVEALALHAGMEPNGQVDASCDVELACSRLGLEAERVELTGYNVRAQLLRSAPAIVVADSLYFGVAGCRGKKAVVLAPGLFLHEVEIGALRDLLCAHAESLVCQRIDGLLERCAVPAERHARAHRALIEEQIGPHKIGRLWRLQMPPGSDFTRQARKAGLGTRMLVLCATHAAEYTLGLAAWYVLGASVLSGHAEVTSLIAWLLLLLTIVPLRIMRARSMGIFGVGLGGLLKQRLLAGTLSLDREEIGGEGVGLLLGRVIESEAVESLALSGGLTAAMAAFELAISSLVLVSGAGGTIQVLLLASWLIVTALLGRNYAHRRARWTESRLRMTNQLVEDMAAHRTRMVQSVPDGWHIENDKRLAGYIEESEALDHARVRLVAVVPRGWLIIALAGMAPVLLSSGPGDLGRMAAGIGGVLLVYQALRRLTEGLSSVADAAVSWKQVAAIFHAAARKEQSGSVNTEQIGATSDVVRAQGLTFRYRKGARPVLRDISFRVSAGDWILLEGSSGSGKSSLASLIAGSHGPESGFLLAGGLDRSTLGPIGWRRHVAIAPQYHQNHILTETLAFNLMLARPWPPNEKDWAEAEAVCRELGLGGLLARMPNGLHQVVGETGWQLSQGERSRVFMARALLQGARLVVMDEPLATLDPENLRQCLECVFRRCGTLMVVAHI